MPICEEHPVFRYRLIAYVGECYQIAAVLGSVFYFVKGLRPPNASSPSGPTFPASPPSTPPTPACSAPSRPPCPARAAGPTTNGTRLPPAPRRSRALRVRRTGGLHPVCRPPYSIRPSPDVSPLAGAGSRHQPRCKRSTRGFNMFSQSFYIT
jgi:hypothetical protein